MGGRKTTRLILTRPVTLSAHGTLSPGGTLIKHLIKIKFKIVFLIIEGHKVRLNMNYVVARIPIMDRLSYSRKPEIEDILNIPY